jgi:ferric-dicitrate binding protein FerR (iron transport regulator)
MKREIDWESLINYLEKNSKPEEKKRIDDWFAGENDKEYFNLIQKIWNAPDEHLPHPNLEQAWLNIKQKTGIVEDTLKETTYSKSKQNMAVVVERLFRSRMLKFAAVFLVIIITYFALFINKPLQMEEIHVGHAQQEKITLEDGSRVHLDAGSIFKYPTQFSADEREVFLNGEGYFEVIPDPIRPFIIHTNKALVNVVGTKFNVRCWEESDQVTVAVLDGNVTLRPNGKKGSSAEVLISANQVSTLRGNDNPSTPHYADLQAYLSWQQREMYFQSATTREVLDQLERWYELEFELPIKFDASNRVTIFIENKPIEEILDVIALMNDFQWQQNGRKIDFSEKKIGNIIP